jgi:hypothetical protein
LKDLTAPIKGIGIPRPNIEEPLSRIGSPLSDVGGTLANTLPKNLTLGVGNVCVGFNTHVKCGNLGNVASLIAQVATSQIRGLNSELGQMFNLTILIGADIACTILLGVLCIFGLMIPAPKSLRLCMLLVLVTLTSPIVCFVSIVYLVQSKVQGLGLVMERGSGGAYGIGAAVTSLVALLVGFGDLVLCQS